MSVAIRRWPALLMLCGALLLLGTAASIGATKAEAATSPYCNNQLLGPYPAGCTGAPRTLYAVYGWGEQGGVCVGVASGQGGLVCSSGLQGAYNPIGSTSYQTPVIINNHGSNNRVHGVAYQP